MKLNRLLPVFVCFFVILFAVFVGCTKNTNPQPPKTDTITKNDTIVKTDTLYASQTDTSVHLAKGLLLYLPFSGSIADSSGNGNSTQLLNGAGLTYDAHGYANNAFGANGGSQALLVTNNGSIQFDTALTVSVDFMTTDLTTRHTFLSMTDYTMGYGASFIVSTSIPGNTTLFDAAFLDSSNECDQYMTGTTNLLTDTTSFVPALGAWYNAVATYEHGTMNVYVNGTLIGTKVTSSKQLNLCPNASVIVGGWWSGDPTGLVGKIDNVRLYNRVLNSHEIAALAANYQVTSNSVKTAPGTATPARFH